MVKVLVEAIDAKDAYTKGHSSRVAEYSREIARRAHYSEAAQSEVYMMGLLHDVGKIGVSDAVITKPGRLTDEEFEQIEKDKGTQFNPHFADIMLQMIDEDTDYQMREL